VPTPSCGRTDFLVDTCHAATPRPGAARVRLPGEGGLARYRAQRDHGVALHPTIAPALAPWSAKLGVAMPSTIVA